MLLGVFGVLLGVVGGILSNLSNFIVFYQISSNTETLSGEEICQIGLASYRFLGKVRQARLLSCGKRLTVYEDSNRRSEGPIWRSAQIGLPITYI